MAGPIIGISYTASGGTAYNFQIDNFGDNAMPRSYVGSASFDLSANGASILGGPAFKQKYQWVISTIMGTPDRVLTPCFRLGTLIGVRLNGGLRR